MAKALVPLVALALSACNSKGVEVTRPALDESKTASSIEAIADLPEQGPPGLAYFAGGCFWGVEHYLEQLDGVLAVESGYMGGQVENPSYEDVLSKKSGHFEAVRVRFEPAKVGFAEIARLFFEIHDPTQADGQGPDIGPQYRSAVFATDQGQVRISNQLMGQLRARGLDVATQLLPAQTFWPAEDYHQDYYQKKGGQPYCHRRVRRFE